MHAVIQSIKNVPSEIIWRALSISLSSFVLVPNIALFMFIIYMAEYDFFSYEFFTEGIFGMKLFFITTVLFLVFLAVILYGPVILYFGKKSGRKISTWNVFGAALVSIFLWAVLIYKAAALNKFSGTLYIFVICVFLATHIFTLFFCKARTQFISLAANSFFIVMTTFYFPAEASKAVSIGLRSFGMGGELPISIASEGAETKAEGKLLLITPKNIYFIPDNGNSVVTFGLANVEHYSVGKYGSTHNNSSHSAN